MEINDYLRKRRIELGITMKALAEKIGVSEGTISRWESGKIEDMRRSRIRALSDALHISPAVIVGDSVDREIPEPDANNELGGRIKALRESRGLTQDDLARLAGYTSKSTIAKIEAGVNSVSTHKISAIAAALSVSPSYLMGWTAERPELRTLFRTAADLSPEDVRVVQAVADALRRKARETD